MQCEGETLTFTQKAMCSRCGEEFPVDKILKVCTKCGGALLFRYDLDRVANSISKNRLEARDDTFWKFIELLPLSSSASIISLGEPYTPVLRLPLNVGSTLDRKSACRERV